MILENIQVNPCHQCITQSILLVQEARICARLTEEPGSPFIYNQSYPLLRIILVHDIGMTGNQLIHMEGLLHGFEPFAVVEAKCETLLFPASWDRIGVQAQPIHELSGFPHQHFRPVVVIHIGASGNFVELVVPVIARISLVTAVQVRIIFRTHVASAAPVLVPDAKIFQRPRLLVPIPGPQSGHWRLTVKGHIFHPFGHLLHGTAAYIAADVRLAFQQLAEPEELMCAEMVVLDNPAPVGVDHPLAGFWKADTVLPVILIGEAAARPAQHGNIELAQRSNHIIADTVCIRNRRILAHPNAFIDTSAEMLGEMPVNIFINFTLWRIR
ncbi:hypothetical protein D3C73_589370 [compost metagenome]